MRKEYIPAMLMYTASFCFFVAAAFGAFTDNTMWSAWLCFGSAMLCIGSANLTAAGKRIREEEEKQEQNGEDEHEETEENYE